MKITIPTLTENQVKPTRQHCPRKVSKGKNTELKKFPKKKIKEFQRAFCKIRGIH